VHLERRGNHMSTSISIAGHFHFGYLIRGMEAAENGDKQVIQAKPRKDAPIPSEAFGAFAAKLVRRPCDGRDVSSITRRTPNPILDQWMIRRILICRRCRYYSLLDLFSSSRRHGNDGLQDSLFSTLFSRRTRSGSGLELPHGPSRHWWWHCQSRA
jgi:hypothetical protein